MLIFCSQPNFFILKLKCVKSFGIGISKEGVSILYMDFNYLLDILGFNLSELGMIP
jgi:hypothetical protein